MDPAYRQPPTDQGLPRPTIVALLKDHGVSPTRQRIEVAEVLFGSPRHVSAEQVMAMLGSKGSAISKATVYNTLNLFAVRGLLRPLVIDPHKIFFDTNTEPHQHFFNTTTGHLQDFLDPVAISNLPAAPAGTEVEGIDIFVRVRAKS